MGEQQREVALAVLGDAGPETAFRRLQGPAAGARRQQLSRLPRPTRQLGHGYRRGPPGPPEHPACHGCRPGMPASHAPATTLSSAQDQTSSGECLVGNPKSHVDPACLGALWGKRPVLSTPPGGQ